MSEIVLWNSAEVCVLAFYISKNTTKKRDRPEDRQQITGKQFSDWTKPW